MGDMVIQLRNDGTDEVGGDVFDENIMNRLLQNVYVSRGIGEAVETRPGAKPRLRDRCERAKIDLSMRARSQVYVGNYFRDLDDEDFDYSLAREELEVIVKPLLDKGFNRIETILKDARFASEQIALCLATGGMSNMPVVKRRLHEWFGPERVQIPDSTATLIAEGAAWIAADGAGLQLAKNVELLLARNSYLPLIKAGTTMPKEGEVQKESFHLYCTDPRDGIAKFQICAPEKPGRAVLPGEPRVHLEIATIKVDQKARPFNERLELDIQINDDLILEAHARSLNAKDEDRREIHNLEFGLSFPVAQHSDRTPDSSRNTDTGQTEHLSPGALSVRANIADREDLRLVPGELLYSLDPSYFDNRRRNLPKYQDDERLYYTTCAKCLRASNDPLCKC
jgi:hypothetical protein